MENFFEGFTTLSDSTGQAAVLSYHGLDILHCCTCVHRYSIDRILHGVNQTINIVYLSEYIIIVSTLHDDNMKDSRSLASDFFSSKFCEEVL